MSDEKTQTETVLDRIESVATLTLIVVSLVRLGYNAKRDETTQA